MNEKKLTAEDCPCQGEDEDPGDHIAACPWSDPEYLPEGYWDDLAAAQAEWREGIERKHGLR